MARPKRTSETPQIPEVTTQEQANQPKVEFYGEGAEQVKFTIDPKATRIRVFNHGLVLYDY